MIFRVNPQKQLYEYLKDATDILKLNMPQNARIIIKPNLNDLQGPQTGTTTDVETVDALIHFLNEQYSPDQVAIVESDSWCRLANEAFSKLGYKRLSEMYKNVKLINLSTAKKIKVSLPRPKGFKFLWIPKIFLEYDYYITVPTLRTLFPTRISCALKNQFGLIPTRYKARYHPYLDNILANLNLLIRPNLCLVDGLIGFDGTPRDVGILILSNDPVANDTIVAKIIGVPPRKIGHLTLSESMGVGNMSEIEIFLDGEKIFDIYDAIQRFSQPSSIFFVGNALGNLLIRSGNRLTSFGRSTIAKVVTSIGPLQTYSKSEILRMLANSHNWKTFLSMSDDLNESQMTS